MAHELRPGRKLARHRGALLKARTARSRAPLDGLARTVHEHHDQAHAPVQADAARLC